MQFSMEFQFSDSLYNKMSAPNTQTASRKRKAYSIRDKLETVDRIRRGDSQTRVAREVGIAESTIRGWLKDEDKLRAASAGMEECGQDRKRHRGAADKDLDAAVMTWFTQSRAEGVPLSGPNIQGQAMKFHKMMKPDDDAFTGSNGWLRGFKDRHGISQVTIRGEQRSADDAAASAYPATLKNILTEGQFQPTQVYNAEDICYN